MDLMLVSAHLESSIFFCFATRVAMKYRDLRDFIAGAWRPRQLSTDRHSGLAAPRDDRDLRPHPAGRRAGPAVRAPAGPHDSGAGQPVRDAAAGGAGHGGRPTSARCATSASCWRASRSPRRREGLRDALGKVALLKSALWDMAPKEVRSAPCQEVVWEGDDVDLARLPIQTCWPGDAGPLITWGLVITRGPTSRARTSASTDSRCIGRNKVIMRWLAHRGGALDFRDHALANPAQPFPIAVALGADPATILGAVTPVPDNLSEYQFAGLLRGGRTETVKRIGSDLRVPGDRRDRARRSPPAGNCHRADAGGRAPATGIGLRAGARRARSATTPAITTSATGSRCSRSIASRCVATRSITRPTPASRPTSRRCSAWR